MPLPGCPSQQEWLAFHFGELPVDTLDLFREHLETCNQCDSAVQNLDRLTDPVIAALRGSQAVVDSPVPGADTRVSRAAPLSAEVDGTQPGEPDLPTLDFLAPPQKPDELGRLAHFRVLKLLGHGGMGIVFLAEDTQLRRQVALKVLKEQLASDRSARQRFLREAQAVARLHNDHVIVVHQVGEAGGVPYFAMEFLQGETLESWRRRIGPPSVAQFLQVAREIAEGLSAAHDQGLIHRDIKPSNIWVEPRADGGIRIELLDFGLALAEMGDTRLTRMGTLVGTPAYMAPEMAEGRKLDSRCDLFCLGSVLYYLATGQAPFAGDSTVAALWAVSFKQPRPVGSLDPRLPAPLADLVMRLLAKDPDDRIPSARAVVEALQAIESGEQPTAVIPRRRNGGPRRRWVVLAALLLGGLAVAAGWWGLHNGATHTRLTSADTGPSTARPTVIASTPHAEEEAWLKTVADMPPREQLAAVVERLKKLNDGYDGALGARVLVTDAGVLELTIASHRIADLSPLRTLKRLQFLECTTNRVGERTPLTDLSPLTGLPLTDLRCPWTSVANLTPLRGMPLDRLNLERTYVHDLEPLRGMMKLTILILGHTPISDLAPIQDLPISLLAIESTRVLELERLRMMPIKHLNCSNTLVTDLSPLTGKPMQYLKCGGSRITNFEPLRTMKLEYLGATIDRARDAKLLQGIETLKTINDMPVVDFWKQD